MLQHHDVVKAVFVCMLLIVAHLCGPCVGQGEKRNPSQQKAERLRKASDILKFINETQDPCIDFYNYACGNWLRYQDERGAKEGNIISEVGQLETKVSKQVQLLLGAPVSMTDLSAKAAKDFYRACTTAQATSPAQKQFIASFVRNNGGMPDLRGSSWQPNYNWIEKIAMLKRHYGMDILITLTVQNNRGNKVYLDEPQKTVLPAQYCSVFATQQIEERDQAIQMEIKNNLKNWLDFGETDAWRVAGDILSFEYQLCRNMRKSQMVDVLANDGGNQPAQMNSRWQENKLHGVRRNMNNNPQPLPTLDTTYRLNFKQFVDISLGNPLMSEAIIRSEDYFAFLGTIANKGLQASFANYIMYRALSEFAFPSDQYDADSRAAFCAQKAMQYFPDIVGSLYSSNIIRNKPDVSELFKDIKDAFKSYLDTNVKWIMHQSTKRFIMNKVEQLELREPEYLDNAQNQDLVLNPHKNYWQAMDVVMRFSANRTLFKTSTSSNVVEAFSTTIATTPTGNQLHMGTALLQRPLYFPTYPKSVQYSGLGFVLAREIARKFDYQGWHENPIGGFSWDGSTTLGFNQYRECFRAQVSSYFFNTPEVYRNGSQLRDIMADSIGVNVAFLAYVTWLDKVTEPLMHLETYPGVNLSNTQLFFLNFAQSRCAAKYRDPGASELFPMDRRTLERLNINGALGNGYEFGRDFNCPAGTEMNLGDKCLSENVKGIK